MPNTDDSVVITQKILDLLTAAKGELGIRKLYYGDQEDLIPEFPAVAVESFPKDRSLAGTHRFEIKLRVGIAIHFGKIQSVQKTKKETEEFAQAIEAILHADKQMDGLVIYGFVTRVEPGISVKRSGMLQTTRMTWEGISRVNFDI